MEPGWVEIMPRKRVTDHVRTWLLSAQTEGQGAAGQAGLGLPDLPQPSPGGILFQKCQDLGPSEFFPFRILSFPEFQMEALPPKSFAGLSNL